jgi:hypothetical protein
MPPYQQSRQQNRPTNKLCHASTALNVIGLIIVSVRWDSDYERTNFGKWVVNLPAFLFFYYVIFGTIWLIFFFIILNIIKVVIALFTKRWYKIW